MSSGTSTSTLVEGETARAIDQAVEHAGVEPMSVPVVENDYKSITDALRDRRGQRYFLLMTFSLAMYLDVSCRSGIVLYITEISSELDIAYGTSTWIPVSFSVPFACFLLFWGRVADMFSPKLVFVGGFYAVGLTAVIVSVCPELYSFFIFRGLSGLFASATIPSAFRLIMMVFEGKERANAIMIFSLTGAVANAAGLILAAVFGFITADGQLAAWRWYFRFVALLAVVFSTLALKFIPSYRPNTRYTMAEKWKRFDLIGCTILLAATLLFIVSLTLGATYGWRTPDFLVPFLLAWPVGACFFFWEKTLKEGHAVVPPNTWKIRNVTLLLFTSLAAFGYWPSTQLPLLEVWLTQYKELPIIAACRLLPQGFASVVPVFILPHIPSRYKSSRWFIAVPYLVCASMLVLVIYSHGKVTGLGYWKYYFPSFIIASVFGAASFTGISVAIMTSVPDEMAGVASALMQVFFQIGGASTFTIQAGLLTLYPGSYQNFHNIQASWWFFAGWYVVAAVIFVVLYRDVKKEPKKPNEISPKSKTADERIEPGVPDEPPDKLEH